MEYNKKNQLTQAQHQVLHKQNKDTQTTEAWIKSAGFNVGTFNSVHVKLLQAQQSARTLLANHLDLLTIEQIKTLRAFMHKMKQKNLREKLKPEHAYPVLNINYKINRQIFKLQKQL